MTLDDVETGMCGAYCSSNEVHGLLYFSHGDSCASHGVLVTCMLDARLSVRFEFKEHGTKVEHVTMIRLPGSDPWRAVLMFGTARVDAAQQAKAIVASLAEGEGRHLRFRRTSVSARHHRVSSIHRHWWTMPGLSMHRLRQHVDALVGNRCFDA